MLRAIRETMVRVLLRMLNLLGFYMQKLNVSRRLTKATLEFTSSWKVVARSQGRIWWLSVLCRDAISKEVDWTMVEIWQDPWFCVWWWKPQWGAKDRGNQYHALFCSYNVARWEQIDGVYALLLVRDFLHSIFVSKQTSLEQVWREGNKGDNTKIPKECNLPWNS